VNHKTLSIIATALSVLALATLVLRHGLFSPSPVVIILQVFAVLLMLWARTTLGTRSFHFSANPTKGGLVTSGPYRYIRHPIYAAVVIFIVAGVVANLSILNGILGLVVVLGMVIRALCEERFLRVEYSEYAEYSRHTWRMIPFVF
jgi:protein-S-isoprenylcysteine O-methyltransferase Ste14